MQNFVTKMEKLNQTTYEIIGAAFKVHTELGPGLLESAYEACLEYELLKKGLNVMRQKSLPIVYKNMKLDAGYRIDIMVNDAVIIEIKAVQEITPIHEAQLMTYLKLSGQKLGLLINFNVTDLKKGIKRIIM